MANMNAQEFREKHARRLKASTADITKGVQGVTESPMVKAAAKADKMLAGVTEAVTTGKWAQRLKAVPLETWKDKFITKGVPRIAAGIDAAADKVEDFAGQLLPHVTAGQSKIKNMPDLTLEDSINRMTTFTRHMAGFTYKPS